MTVDGAEGGTGAAPLEFTDDVGMSFELALIFVNKTLVSFEIRDKIRVICSGKIISGYSILHAVALGADICNSARGFMFSHRMYSSLEMQQKPMSNRSCHTRQNTDERTGCSRQIRACISFSQKHFTCS